LLYVIKHSDAADKDLKAVTETAISDLLNKTPGEIGLYKKYRIACESLISWYEKGLEPYSSYNILTEFIQKIEDAIENAEENTDGQST
jgi:hypothetical protein